MLRQVCRRGRLEAILGGKASDLEEQKFRSLFASALPNDAVSTAQMMPLPSYELLLRHLNMSMTTFRDHRALPHPPRARILSPWAQFLRHVTIEQRIFAIARSHVSTAQFYFGITATN